jgi:hypothetical protein
MRPDRQRDAFAPAGFGLAGGTRVALDWGQMRLQKHERGARVMTSRTLLAGFVAVLSAGALLAPIEASARAGGMGMGRVGGFHGGFRPLSMRPFGHIRPGPRPGAQVRPAPHPIAQIRPAPRPLVRPPGLLPRHHFAGPRHDLIRPRLGRHHHRPAFPVAGVTVYSGSPSYSPDYSGWPTADDAAADAARRSYVVPTEYPSGIQAAVSTSDPAGALRHVCRADVETVPSERGGKSEITVTRCYRTE